MRNTGFGRGDKIRTCDFHVPNVALYQTEPHLEKSLILKYYSMIYDENQEVFLEYSSVIFDKITAPLTRGADTIIFLSNSVIFNYIVHIFVATS